jgi:hypothetical protein
MSVSDQSRIAWRKSSHSSTNGGECVELAVISHEIGIRDSKNPNGPRLIIPPGTGGTTSERSKSQAPRHQTR